MLYLPFSFFLSFKNLGNRREKKNSQEGWNLLNTCFFLVHFLRKLFQANMQLNVDFSAPWSSFLLQLVGLRDRKKRHIALLASQIFIYYIWRERNTRNHNGELSSPDKILADIMINLRARLASTSWFSSFITTRLDAAVWLSL